MLDEMLDAFAPAFSVAKEVKLRNIFIIGECILTISFIKLIALHRNLFSLTNSWKKVKKVKLVDLV